MVLVPFSADAAVVGGDFEGYLGVGWGGEGGGAGLARRAHGLLSYLGVSAGICVNVVGGGFGGALGVGWGGGGGWALSPLGTWTFELFGGLRGGLCECCWGWFWEWFGGVGGATKVLQRYLPAI